MIHYHAQNWFESLRHFKRSYVIRRTLRMCLWVGLYTLAIAACDLLFRTHPDLRPHQLAVLRVDPVVFSLLGIFLSLMLVFRTNTAYDRWWEGRKQWGALINHTRGLAVLWHGMLAEADQANRQFFARAISAFALALSAHLRGQAQPAHVAPYGGATTGRTALVHIPNQIVRDLYARTEQLYRAGLIDGFQLGLIKPETQAFLDIQGACERIKATPIPFAHNFFIKLFVLAYIAIMPFVLVPHEAFGFLAVPVTMFVAYALVGIEYISVEIEEPFGLDCNDLPTHNLALKIQANVHELLGVAFEPTEMEQQAAYVVIN